MSKLEVHLRNFIKGLKGRFPRLFSDHFLVDSTNRIMFGVTAALYLAVWIISVLKFQPSDYLVPTSYTNFLGVTSLGKWYELYVIPLILTICIVLNLILGDVTYKKDKMVSYIFVATNIFIAMAALTVVINFSFLLGN